MGLVYKINIMKALKEKGITTYELRKNGYFSESTLTKFRRNKGVSWDNLEMLCRLLDCQPSDLIEYIKD